MNPTTMKLEKKEKKTQISPKEIRVIPTKTDSSLQGPICVTPGTIEQLEQIDETHILEQIESSQLGREVEIESDGLSESSSKGSSVPPLSSELGQPDSDDCPMDALTEQAEIYSRTPLSRLPLGGTQHLPGINYINVGTVCHANQLETIKAAIKEYITLMGKQYNINLPIPKVYGAIGECQRSENLVARFKMMDLDSVQAQPSTSKQDIPMQEEEPQFSKSSQTLGVEKLCMQRGVNKDTEFEVHPLIKHLKIGVRLKPLLGVGRDLIINSSTKGFALEDIKLIYNTPQSLPAELNILLITLLKKQNKFNQMSKRYNLFDISPLNPGQTNITGT